MTFLDRVEPQGKKKLLALDGGGIRGIITLEVLAAVEQIVRRQLKRDDAVLADYFDYIAGTSTGAIIATCLSVGMSVAHVSEFYQNSGKDMFSRAGILRRLHYRFEDEKLAAQLQQVLGRETMLGSDKVKTLLMMVMRNATTDSPWPITNNPKAKYNDPKRPDCNLRIPLWQLVRASTAAPTYFPPELVRVGEHDFLFVDGGVTMYNNPAFQLFLMATVEPYNLQWKANAADMLLVSIGTGTSPQANANLQPGDMNLLYNAGSIPSALMYAALNEQDFLCRTFGECLSGCALDREVGDMIGKSGPAKDKLFTYVRYNGELTKDGLAALGLPQIQPEAVQALDSVDHMPELRAVGQAIARQQVRAEHFARFATA